ncbi:DUF4760 domain-containing protein [Bathymodiolus thermophilus thioautotrophic gill symbiont]|uniref:DUF4760 domain-containing protein n=1 Tax=Bathymodiolus thermophilus thioautotrophic gill symbiont TaxID=2360 RepID=UPI0015D5CBDC|nr:DUF4760 domain-containing protein [Bathymodiolus thermophilus thioautotrophic gill symbiont]
MIELDGQTTFQVIQTATLIVAVFVAWISIKKQRETIKKEKTIGLLMKDLEDDFLTDGLKILRKIDKEYHIEDFAKANKKNSDDAIAIRNLLNYYEIIGVGIESDIYDIAMIKDAQKTMIIRIYEQAEPFIIRSRQEDNNANLWIKFQNLIDILRR